MTVALRKIKTVVDQDPEIFHARVEAIAMRWIVGEMLLVDAADLAQRLAWALGLDVMLGDDEVQRLMGEAFAAAVRDRG